MGARRNTGWLVLSAVLVVICRTAQAQAVSSSRDTVLVLRQPIDRTGIPAGTKINGAMFRGIVLTKAQGDSIARLVEYFAIQQQKEYPTLQRGGVWGSATKAKMRPFIERQRLAYRAVLKREQRSVFDRNTQAILRDWLRTPARPISDSTSHGH
jgi:hypothetical protein